MKKEWFAAKELTGIAGLPSSPQGVNLMAKRQGWEQRRRLGVQGKALEYHVDSLPDTVFNLLQLNENTACYSVNGEDPLAIWVGAFNQLTESKRKRMTSFILSAGIEKLVELVNNKQMEDLLESE
ncbi:DNA-binding protein [Candidatus Fukatsuia symbiotica]|uniref:DNA-binding protein n=1 Tax=Candidatus Fukatsuia symbiotica TaxID=1878942 RepID=A0A2U8I6D8_9GAMM|nr:DNA-binding protein [Candidatus Fukatsuia symbiotica]AWK14667.1 DNA-binding protein [Candidatus Fukatsuia symbiotica]MEA9444982.1 DNA-binding protein [Candidatus Fukatsuia symbiotica]